MQHAYFTLAPYSLSTLATIVADFGDAENGDCRRKVRLSPNSATVAVFSPFSTTVALFLRQSPVLATVALFCDSVDRALRLTYNSNMEYSLQYLVIL